MYREVFEKIGLTENEAKIYEVLLSTGETSVSVISTRAQVHRRNVYDTLNRLQEKGLVFGIFQKGENHYQAVHPDKLLEGIKEKEEALKFVLPDLRSLYESEPTKNAAYIYRGIEGYKNYRRDLLRESSETFFLGAKGLWHSPQIDDAFRRQYVRPFSKDVVHKTLFDPRIPSQLPKAMHDVGGEYKVLPAEFQTPGVVDMFGDYVVTFTSVGIGNIGDDITIFVMKNKELAESYKTWFRLIWSLLPEEKK